jgi:hypothetical protein
MGAAPNRLSLDQIKKFYDPYDGKVFAIPEKVKKVVHELNGQSLTIRKAMKRIEAVAYDSVNVRNVTFDPDRRCILLDMYGDGYTVQCILSIIKFE